MCCSLALLPRWCTSVIPGTSPQNPATNKPAPPKSTPSVTKATNLAPKNKGEQPHGTETTENNILPPYDPRNEGDNAPPTPDKPPIPKAHKPLIVNPSTITLYKDAKFSGHLKDGITEMDIKLSNADGKAMYFPEADPTSDITLIASTFDTKPVWVMEAGTEYASVGTKTIPITAIAADGSVSYVGLLHVTVLPLPPTFTISTNKTSAAAYLGSSDFYCGDLAGISYSSGFDPAYIPTITVQSLDNHYNFSSLGFSDYAFHLRSTTLIEQTANIHVYINVQNKFQLYTIPCEITIRPI